MNETNLQDHQPLCTRIGIALLAIAALELFFLVSTVLAKKNLEAGAVLLVPAALTLLFPTKRPAYWLTLAAAALLVGVAVSLPATLYLSEAWITSPRIAVLFVPYLLLAFLILAIFSKASILYFLAFGTGIGLLVLPLRLVYYPPGLWWVALKDPFWATFSWGLLLLAGACFCGWCFRALTRPEVRSAMKNIHIVGWAGLGFGLLMVGGILWGLNSESARVGKEAIREALGPQVKFRIHEAEFGTGPDVGRGSATVIAFDDEKCWREQVTWPPPPLPHQVQTQNSPTSHLTIGVTGFPGCPDREALPKED